MLCSKHCCKLLDCWIVARCKHCCIVDCENWQYMVIWYYLIHIYRNATSLLESMQFPHFTVFYNNILTSCYTFFRKCEILLGVPRASVVCDRRVKLQQNPWHTYLLSLCVWLQNSCVHGCIRHEIHILV